MIQLSEAHALFLTRLVRGALLVYLGVGAMLLIFEKDYVYFPDTPGSPTFLECADFHQDVERIERDGVRFFYQPPLHETELPPRIAVLYHGNAGSACDRAFFGNTFLGAGYSYIVLEYPGYGGDPTTRPSRALILSATHTIQEFIAEREYGSVVLVGESLGSGVALYHATHTAPQGLILISPYYRLSDAAGWIGWVYPAHLLMRENYEAGMWARNVSAPTLLIRAGDDEIFPRASTLRLYGALQGAEKRLVEVQGATHNRLYGFTEFHQAITEFLNRGFTQ